MLEECWMKFYIVQMCHSACFNQGASPFILSFNVKSKIATDMLLPVILSELVKSNDEKPHRSRTREWISFLNLTFLCYFFYIAYFLWSACFLFFRYLQFLLLHLRILPHFVLASQIDGQNLLCCWSSSILFDVYDFFIVIILQGVLILLNHSKFEVLTFEVMSEE